MTDAPPQAVEHSTHTDRSALLDERYGVKRQRGLDRRLGWVVAVVAVVVGTALILPTLWKSEPVSARDVHYTIIDDRTAAIDFEVTAPANTPVACALEALSPSYATVGWRVVELPLSDARTRQFYEEIVTTQLATTTTLNGCWVLESSTAR